MSHRDFKHGKMRSKRTSPLPEVKFDTSFLQPKPNSKVDRIVRISIKKDEQVKHTKPRSLKGRNTRVLLLRKTCQIL